MKTKIYDGPIVTPMKTPVFLFSCESDHQGFLSWLRAYESENKTDSMAKIGFIRDPFTSTFSRWSVAVNETIINAALAFNARLL